MPHMKLSALTPLDYSKPSLRFLAGFATQIAFLDQPKRALRIVRNEQLMQAYQVAVQREAKGARMRHSPLAGSLMQCAPQAAPLPFSKPAQACCRCFVQRPKLAVSSVRHACGAAHIALADIGAAYERSDLLARMAKQTIDANAGMPGVANVVVKVTARALLESPGVQAADVVVCGASIDLLHACLR